MDTDDLEESVLPEYREKRIRPDWALSDWADRILEEAGVGVTILDRDGVVIYYNRWAALYMDRKPSYIDDDVRNRHFVVDGLPTVGHGHRHDNNEEHGRTHEGHPVDCCVHRCSRHGFGSGAWGIGEPGVGGTGRHRG